LHSRAAVSPDLEPQGAESIENIQSIEIIQPMPPPAAPAPAPLSWIPTRRWLHAPVGSVNWSVEERHLPDGPSLFFMHDDGFVRVRDYPSNWRELPDATLADLLRHPRGERNQA
jgi:hypothetical protein